MDKISSSMEQLDMKHKREAMLQAVVDLKRSEDEQEAEYKEDKVLKQFLGKPTEYGNLQKLLTGKTPSKQSKALQNLIKGFDRNSGENNKALLSQLFANLLQYISDLFSNLKDEKEISKSFFIMKSIGPQFYKIARIDEVSSWKSFAKLLTEKYNEYHKNPQQIPDLDTLIFFKLVSPTTYFPNHHGMTNPCFTFMSEILTICKFQNARSISRGLFVSALMLEYTSLKKRYVPAGIDFLRGVLFLAATTTNLHRTKPTLPFNFHRNAKILILEDDCSKLDFGMRISPQDLFTDSIDNGFKIRTLLTTVLVLNDFFNNCDEYEKTFIFEAHKKLLKCLKTELYPEKVSITIQKTIKYFAYKPDVQRHKNKIYYKSF